MNFDICDPQYGAYDPGHPACEDEQFLVYVGQAASGAGDVSEALAYATKYCGPGEVATALYEDGSVTCAPALPDTATVQPGLPLDGLGLVLVLLGVLIFGKRKENA